MKIGPIIKAPFPVQLNRIAFAFYTSAFIWALWKNHHSASSEGWFVLSGFLFFSLLGFAYSCVRTLRSRWIMSAIVVLIPATVVEQMFQMKIFSTPQTWWEWLLDPLAALVIWFGLPVIFAFALFKDKKTEKYFSGART
jgi:hypothetical protein